MSKPKELNFFIEERNWPRGIDWYKAQFDADARVRGEASPNYTAFPQHQGVPERMASVVPDAKLIYMVRDPLERIAAHWVHNYAKRREKGTLARDARAPEHLLRHPLEVRDAARALPRALPEGAGPRLPAVRASPQADGDAAARCSSSSASIPTSSIRASSRSATRPRARPGRPGSRCSSRRWAAAAAGRGFPTELLARARRPAAVARAIKRPDVRAALPAETLAELRADGRAPARAHRPRLLQLEDLGRLSRVGAASVAPAGARKRRGQKGSSTTIPGGSGAVLGRAA